MHKLFERLLPRTDDALLRGRAMLVAVTCLSVSAAYAALIGFWFLTGDLDCESIVVWGVLSAILGGIIVLARRGRVALSAWIIVGLLTLLIAADVSSYGVGEPGSAGFTLPILFAACTLGFWPALGVALVSSAAVWLTAAAEIAGWWDWLPAPVESHLTFNAPMYTVIFVLVALVAGLWNRYLTQQWQSSSLKPAEESFRQGWQEALKSEALPIAEL
jgi:hypothetical protein